MPSSRYIAILFLLVLAVLRVPLYSQATDGNITGFVKDPTGAVIPAADVELLHYATGVLRSAQSDSGGTYRFNNVPVGRYKITARATGFAAGAVENVDIVLNRTATANVTLQVGQVATQIEVTEATALIDTTTASIGASFESKQAVYNPMTDLPLGIYNLALLGAGVASSGGVGLGEGPSIGGQRPRNNNFTIEGADNTRRDVTGANLRVPNEAVQEFSMLQNQTTAEFGHSTGGQFNTVVKSGTNAIHGSVYEYLQNRNLNAVDEADARQGIRSTPRLDDNRLGGSIGGPVIKNRLFYFGNLEYNPLGQASSPSAAVLTPTAQGYQVLGAIPGLSKTNLDILKQYAPPAPSASGTTLVKGTDVPIGILPISFPNYINTYNWVGSVDYNHSERDQIRFRYLENRNSGIDINTSPTLAAFSDNRTTKARLFSLSEFHTFTPSLFNELRLSYNRYDDNIPAGDFQYPGLDMFPNITIEEDLSLQIGPYDNAPQSTIINTYQLSNNTTYVKGRNSFKFGIDARKYIAPSDFIQRQRGDYNYSNLERFLLDLNPDVQAERNVGGVPFSGNAVDFYWYAQDEMKLRPNVTLNVGLRYEFKGMPRDDSLQALNAISSVPGVLEFRAPKTQKKNFAPRVGLAWAPGSNGRTVVRAGFGMAYDVYFDNLSTLSKPPQLENTFRVPPAQNVPNFLANGGIRPDQRPDSLDQETARALTSTYIQDQNLPYSIQWNFGLQRVFADDYTVEVRYLGTRGVRLYTQSIINLRGIATPSRSLPTFLQQPSQSELDKLTLTLDDLYSISPLLPEFENNGLNNAIFAFPQRGNSVYHGLATEVTRRFSKGLQFKGAYTWSHNIDDSTADLYSTLLCPRRPQDFQDMRAERGSSFLDRRHRLTFTWVYEAPWFNRSPNWFARNLAGNWIFSGTYTAESPQLATVQSGLDSNLNWDAAGDRAIVNPKGVDGVGSDVTPLLNTAGQIVGYLADNPNARYIVAGEGAFPNGGRNTLPMGGINNFDVALTKRFSVSDRTAFELRAAFYNTLNHPQYTPGDLNTVRGVDSRDTRNHLIPGNPLFNDPTRVFSSHPRAIHLVARFTF